MRTIMMADDDILSLNRIRTIMDWEAHGYCMAGAAGNGAECLSLMKEEQPDILLLDIDMPVKNGVQVTKEIQELNYRTRVLILSNYDDFVFVRDAMRYGASDYLLKHEITEAILLAKLEEISRESARSEQNIRRIRKATAVARQQYLHDLLAYGIFDEAGHHDICGQEGAAARSAVLVVIQITNFIAAIHFTEDKERKKLIDSILNLAASISAILGNGIFTYMEYGQFAALFHFQDASTQKILDMVNGNMRLMVSNVRKLFQLNMAYQASDIVTEPKRLRDAYLHTVQLLNKRTFDNSDTLTAQCNSIDIMEEKQLMDALVSLDFKMTGQILGGLSDKYGTEGGNLPPQLLHQLVQLVSRYAKSQGVPRQAFKPHEESSAEKGNLAFLHNYCRHTMETVMRHANPEYSEHVRSAIQSIHENYKEEITLAWMAEQLHLSSSYLSRIFHQETGSSFIEYLTSYRIELAQRLIRSSHLGLKEISAQAGFANYNYFLRVYKEKTGHTPSQER